ncbi:hypothetical protein [Halioxenophilus sp. WMMB6]|uniref:tetratricopeptide repeat protein n=1 Tax=Halioxenophilus sp. WMMB6 TaxID=3073815 RepID=UPI00295E8491|nr:hypothetical protein [Halioxenophilus sp. WMMB6]
MRQTLAILVLSVLSLVGVDALADPHTQLQADWAKANYLLQGDEKLNLFEKLLAEADAAKQANPKDARVFIWSGIINSSYAGAKGGLGALKFAKQAKRDLEAAMAIDESALQGSAFTSLGTLYFKVPGWPIGFGDDKKAETMLKKALAINPTGIDSNYFYADYLYAKGDYEAALRYAKLAEQAPARPDRPVADEGRHGEISELLQKISAKLI